MSRFIPLYFIIVCLLFKHGSTIKCYQCNSALDEECKGINSTEPTSTTAAFLKECTMGTNGGQEPFCRKIVQTILDDVKTTRVIRSCGWIRSRDAEREDKCRSGDTDFILEKNCECFGDACNAGTRLGLFGGYLVLVLCCINKLMN